MVGRSKLGVERNGGSLGTEKDVGIIYGLTTEQIARKHGGLAMLAQTNVRELNDFDVELSELNVRVKAADDA
jgi:hypothetical protein